MRTIRIKIFSVIGFILVLGNIAVSNSRNLTDIELQQIRVTGKISSQKTGMPISGVTVSIKGKSGSTITSETGDFTINVSNMSDKLVFTHLGYQSLEAEIPTSRTLSVHLVENDERVEEVVVTALGIKRSERSLGYSVGVLDNEQLNKVNNENFMNAMAAKTPGVSISSTGGTGSSVNMVIRGATSLSSDNQPLIVVDGVPVQNTVNNVGEIGDRNKVDYGNSISSLNSENIASITILKGPSAAALYGSRAGNGVLLITTKSAEGLTKPTIHLSSNTVFDIPYKYLKTQSKFGSGQFSAIPPDISGSPLTNPFGNLVDDKIGGGFGAELDKGWESIQWNSPLNENGKYAPLPLISHPDNVKNFVQTGLTTTNGISIANNLEKLSYRIAYSNMTNQGIIPKTNLFNNTLSLNSILKFNDNLSLSTNVDISKNNSGNRAAGNRGTNPLEAAYLLSANVNILDMKDYWIEGLEGLEQKTQDIHNSFSKRQFNNPYFLVNEVKNSFVRDRIFGNVRMDWKPSTKLSFMARFAMDKLDFEKETKIGQSYSREKKGAYGISFSRNMETNTDFLASYTDKANQFSYSVSAGGNWRYQKGNSIHNATKASGSGLIMPNVYSISNILPENLDYYDYRSEKGVLSFYGLANLGYADMIYLDITGRSDWSSTLPGAKAYFYPSASLSLIANDLLSLPESINLLKLRGGVAQVGNDTSPYQLLAVLNRYSTWGDLPRLGTSSVLKNAFLKPEKATSIEGGIDLNMFNNRLRSSFTIYKNDNKNQIFNTKMPPSSGAVMKNINSGLLVSKGIEFSLGGNIVQTNDWHWSVDANISRNRTRIMELSDDLPYFTLWEDAKGGAWTYVGDEIGDIYDAEVRRVTDKSSPYYGFPLLDQTGKWVAIESDNTKNKIGNFNPKFMMGLQSTISYKNMHLSFSLDWRNGGDFISQTYRQFEEEGRSALFMDKLFHADKMEGKELRDFLMDNADEHIRINSGYFPLVGGPTPEYGSVPFVYPPYTLPYGGVFIPGVYEGKDANGDPILIENLGENLTGKNGTKTLPLAGATTWSFARPFLYDASYLKLREISFTYDLPSAFVRKMRMEKLSVSVFSRNIMLWTKAKINIDPEQAFQPEGGVQGNGSQFKQGIERYNINPWVMPIGFKLGVTF